MAHDRRAGDRRVAQAPVREPRPVPGRRRRRHSARRRRVPRDRRSGERDRPAVRAARPPVPPAHRRALGVLPRPARCGERRDLALLRRLLPVERGHAARAHLLPVPRVPRGDGARAGRGRRLRVHGGLGVDGALVVLPGHDRAPDPRDPPRRFPLPADRARRRDRHPAVLRRAAGRQRRLHVRGDARHGALPRVGVDRVLPRAVRLRREGRHPAAARVAARGAPGRTVARLRADERRDAEDRDLRAPARRVRPAAAAAVVVGRGRARVRARHGALRRHLRRGADRHEAPARLLVDREHRHHRRRHGRRSGSSSRCSASARRRASCRCTCGCPRRTRPHRRPCPR